MTTVLALMLLFSAIALVIMILFQAARGTVELLSTRNFFLLGFIIFQLISGVMTLTTGAYDVLPVGDQPRSGAIYTFLTLAFLVVFLWAYRRRRLAHWLALRFSSDAVSPGPASMLALGYVLLGLGLLLKIALVRVPLVAQVADPLGSSYLALAVGIAAWSAAPRLLNPAVLLPAGFLVMCCFLASMSLGAFGRRDIVVLVITMAWGAYYGHWRYLGPSRMALHGCLVLIPGLLLFGAFTATRSAKDSTTSPSQVVSRLLSARPTQGLYELGTGQYAAANSMWLIQTRPESYPYDTLHTLRYMAFHPVPRAWWPDKPTALGMVMPDQGHVRRVDKALNLGPGLIGHIYNDNPWLAFLPYTLMLAFFLAFLDELVRVRAWNPFVVLPVAVGLGQIVAMPRGELGLFFVLAVTYIAGGWIAMTVIAVVLRSLGLIARAPPAEEWQEGDEEPEWPGESAAAVAE